MKEKTIEELLVKLMRECGMGEIVDDIESVSGGLMHRMYKVTTDSGIYAVKHLNAEIMKRPDAHEDYARAEKIEGILEKSDIPIVPAMVISGKKMQNIGGQFFYVFKWQEGQITDWNRISEEQCYKAGNILGRIHAIEPENVEHQSPELSQIDWHGYMLKAKEEDSEIASLLEDNEELLMYVESELNKARASLPAMLCISNEDMDPKNIMWDNGTPWVIDLECLDYGNPTSHAMQLALQWSGIVTCELDINKMVAFFDGYLNAYDNCFRGYGDIVGVAYTWVEWLEYNIQRALGNCIDEAERALGISEVRNTIDRIEYIHRMEPQIKVALNTRLSKAEVSHYDNHDERLEVLMQNKDWLFTSDEYICDLRTVAVLVRDGKILVQRERAGSEYALPGGHVKIGETLEAGLIRETLEEMGVRIDCKRMLWSEECFWEWNGKQAHNIAFYYLIELCEELHIPDDGEFVSHKDNCNVVIGWMPIEKLQEITIYPEFIKKEIFHLDEPMKHFVSRG